HNRDMMGTSPISHPASVSCPASYMPITTFVTPIFEGGAIGKPVPVTRYVPCPGDGSVCGASAAQAACTDPREEQRATSVTFVDSGTVGGNTEVQEYRVFAGAGIRIVVPMLGPVPIALDFGFPIDKPETAQGTAEPLPPPQCCPPLLQSSAEVHS